MKAWPSSPRRRAPNGSPTKRGRRWAWDEEHGVPLHTHCLESPLQAEYARRMHAAGPAAPRQARGIARSDGLGSRRVPDRRRLPPHGPTRRCSITNPGSNLRLRCGVSPVLTALDHGVTVALGTRRLHAGRPRQTRSAEMRLLLPAEGSGHRHPGADVGAGVRAATTSAGRRHAWRGELADQAARTAESTVLRRTRPPGRGVHPGSHPYARCTRAARSTAGSVVGGRVVWSGTAVSPPSAKPTRRRASTYFDEQGLGGGADLPGRTPRRWTRPRAARDDRTRVAPTPARGGPLYSGGSSADEDAWPGALFGGPAGAGHGRSKASWCVGFIIKSA